MKPDETFTFSSQRLTLSAAAWGDPARPLVILVHGGLDQKRSWDWTASALRDDYRVVVYDLRGHGDSEWVNDGDYALMDHVFDLASLIRHLGAKEFRLVGHSLGGHIALRYCGLYPDGVLRLAAIEGLGPSPKMLAERAAQDSLERMRDWVDSRVRSSAREPRKMESETQALERMTKAHSHLSAEQLAHLTRTGIRKNPDASVSWKYDPAFLGKTPSDITHDDFKTMVGAIPIPVWLAYGEKSWASNPEGDGRVAYFRNASVKEYPDAGHWLHHDSYNEFVRDLRDYLSD